MSDNENVAKHFEVEDGPEVDEATAKKMIELERGLSPFDSLVFVATTVIERKFSIDQVSHMIGHVLESDRQGAEKSLSELFDIIGSLFDKMDINPDDIEIGIKPLNRD